MYVVGVAAKKAKVTGIRSKLQLKQGQAHISTFRRRFYRKNKTTHVSNCDGGASDDAIARYMNMNFMHMLTRHANTSDLRPTDKSLLSPLKSHQYYIITNSMIVPASSFRVRECNHTAYACARHAIPCFWFQWSYNTRRSVITRIW